MLLMANCLPVMTIQLLRSKQLTTQLVDEDSATDVSLEDSATDVPVEDSTIDIPKEGLATSTIAREEQTTTDGKAKASSGS